MVSPLDAGEPLEMLARYTGNRHGNLGLDLAALGVMKQWGRELSTDTATEYGRTLKRFVAFAASSGITSIRHLDLQICCAFAMAPLGGARAGEAPSPQTSRLRWGVVAGFLRSVPIEQVPLSLTRMAPPVFGASRGAKLEPLVPGEVVLVRRLGRLAPMDSLRPVIVEAALAGATAAEIAVLTVGDFDSHCSTLRLAGRPHVRPRVAPLDEYAARVIAARVDWLSSPGRCGWGSDPLERSLALPRPREQYRPGSLAPVVSSGLLAAMEAAGVRRPGVRSRSLLSFTANRTYALTGRVESVAELLGRSSLDTAAGMVDQGWQERWGDLIRGAADPGRVRDV